MKCNVKNCDDCPYPDCILSDEEAVIRAKEEGMFDQEIAEREQRRLEARRRARLAYYYRHKEERIAYAKEYQARKRREKREAKINGM